MFWPDGLNVQQRYPAYQSLRRGWQELHQKQEANHTESGAVQARAPGEWLWGILLAVETRNYQRFIFLANFSAYACFNSLAVIP